MRFRQYHSRNLSAFAAVGALLASIVGASPPTAASDGGHGAPDLTRARYILSIARFTEWPQRAFARPDSTLRVCFLERAAYLSATETLTGKTVGKRPISVLWIADAEEAQRCHVLHVGEGHDHADTAMLRSLARSPVLTICEEPNFAERGGIVGIKAGHDGPELRINLRAAGRAGLRLSSDLLQLGTVTDARPAAEHAD